MPVNGRINKEWDDVLGFKVNKYFGDSNYSPTGNAYDARLHDSRSQALNDLRAYAQTSSLLKDHPDREIILGIIEKAK